MSYTLFDVPVYTGSLEDLISQFSKPGMVLSFNPEIAWALPRQAVLGDLFQKNSWNLIDGVGIAWALKKKYRRSFGRISGIDLVQALFKRGGKFFILGSTPAVLEQALQTIARTYPAVQISGSHSGYFSKSQETELVSKIMNSGAQYLLLGMGFPRQEQFLLDHPQLAQRLVAVVMGGSLDVISGAKKRAPHWLQRAGLEWLFRLLQEPRRLWRQRVLLLFIFKVIFSRITQ